MRCCSWEHQADLLIARVRPCTRRVRDERRTGVVRVKERDQYFRCTSGAKGSSQPSEVSRLWRWIASTRHSGRRIAFPHITRAPLLRRSGFVQSAVSSCPAARQPSTNPPGAESRQTGRQLDPASLGADDRGVIRRTCATTCLRRIRPGADRPMWRRPAAPWYAYRENHCRPYCVPSCRSAGYLAATSVWPDDWVEIAGIT